MTTKDEHYNILILIAICGCATISVILILSFTFVDPLMGGTDDQKCIGSYGACTVDKSVIDNTTSLLKGNWVQPTEQDYAHTAVVTGEPILPTSITLGSSPNNYTKLVTTWTQEPPCITGVGGGSGICGHSRASCFECNCTSTSETWCDNITLESGR